MAGFGSPPEQLADSDTLELGDRPFVGDVPGVQCRFWFDQDNVDLFVRNGQCSTPCGTIINSPSNAPDAHHRGNFMRKEPLHDEKSSSSLFVMMPQKFSFELDGFHKAIIDFRLRLQGL